MPTTTDYGYIGVTGLTPLTDKEENKYCYKAVANGVGFSIGDVLTFIQIYEVDSPLTPIQMVWFNNTTLQTVFVNDTLTPANNMGTFPNIADLKPCEDETPKRELKGVLAAKLCIYGSNVPSTFIPYSFNGPIASFWSPATNANDLYIHAIFETIAGQGFDVITGAIFTGVTNGVLATDIVSCQMALDQALLSAGYSIGQAIYTIDSATNEIVIWQDPTLAIPLFNIWAGDQQVPGSYTNKVDIDTLSTALLPSGGNCISCREVQLEKWLEVDGVTISEELYEIGTRNLVTPLSNEVLGFGGCIINKTETANATQILGNTTFTIPSNVVSFTVSAQSGSFDLSFNNGITYALTNRIGSRTFGQGTIEVLNNTNNIVVRGSTPTSDIDIIWEI